MTSVSTDRRFGVQSGAAMKVPVRVATTANITLSGEQTIDGVAVVTDDRVLVKNQTTSADNGIYICDSGDWTRDADCDGSYDLKKGTFVYVNSGTVSAGMFYVCTSSDPITIGSSNITWAQIPVATIAGVSAFMLTVLDDTTSSAARTTLGVAIGSDVEAYSASHAFLNVEDQALTGGVVVTSKSLGTVSSGTVTPDPGARPLQHYTNNGAHTIGVSTNTGACYVDITNGASAGAITTSSYTKVTGDSFDTTNGHKFRVSISIGNGGSLLVNQALQ